MRLPDQSRRSLSPRTGPAATRAMVLILGLALAGPRPIQAQSPDQVTRPATLGRPRLSAPQAKPTTTAESDDSLMPAPPPPVASPAPRLRHGPPPPGSPAAIEAELVRIRADLRDIKTLLRVMVIQMGIPTGRRTGVATRGGEGARTGQGQPGGAAPLAGAGPLPVLQRMDDMESRLGEINQVQSTVTTIQNTLADNAAKAQRSQLLSRVQELRGLLIDTAHSSSQEFGNIDVTLYFYLDGEPDHYDPALKYAQELQTKVDALEPLRQKLSEPERQALDQVESWGRNAKIIRGLAAVSPGIPVLH